MAGANRSASFAVRRRPSSRCSARSFADYEIVSAGPDRTLFTADDINFASVQKNQQFGWMAGVWFLEERERLALTQSADAPSGLAEGPASTGPWRWT